MDAADVPRCFLLGKSAGKPQPHGIGRETASAADDEGSAHQEEWSSRMNKSKVTGKLDQVAGKIKEKIGESVGDQKLANSGAAQQLKGAAKEAWGNAKDTAASVSDSARAHSQAKDEDLRRRGEEKAHDIREKITSTAQNVKENINARLDRIKREEHDEIRQVH
ncbi:MAG TPA: CsbD family protein [Edaphobacter sp.]|nr:CsbD family protein [Edaphobacter sp.]